jgi:hypothetical protein
LAACGGLKCDALEGLGAYRNPGDRQLAWGDSELPSARSFWLSARESAPASAKALDLVTKLKVTPEDNDTSRALTKQAAEADKRTELSKLNAADFDEHAEQASDPPIALMHEATISIDPLRSGLGSEGQPIPGKKFGVSEEGSRECTRKFAFTMRWRPETSLRAWRCNGRASCTWLT